MEGHPQQCPGFLFSAGQCVTEQLDFLMEVNAVLNRKYLSSFPILFGLFSLNC